MTHSPDRVNYLLSKGVELCLPSCCSTPAAVARRRLARLSRRWAPQNKGQGYPADPPTVDEIVAVMRRAGDGRHGRRRRGLIVVLWRAGLRIHEALALAETDLDERRGSVLVRHGKGDRRREVGMDPWAWLGGRVAAGVFLRACRRVCQNPPLGG
jgi:integrase